MSGYSRLLKFASVAFAASMAAVVAYAQRVPPAQSVPRTPREQNDRYILGPIPLPNKPVRFDPCVGLKFVAIPNTTIVSVTEVTSGTVTPSVPPSLPQPPVTGLPPFCRVIALSKPSPTSSIGLEVWLPLGATYNGRYEQVGNGGFAGAVNYDGLGETLRRGFATASTDDGHQGAQDPTFANISHDRIVDFGWRALKQTTNAAKTLIQTFYGAAPKFSYFFGCSDGGREAMMEVQRFPTDFDGIIAGAPANHWTHQFTALAYNTQAAFEPVTPFPPIVPAADLKVLAGGVRKQCAGKDGGLATDLFLTDPRACVIDWTKIQCAPGQMPGTCLSAAEVATVQKIYAGAKNSSGQIYGGYLPGSEDDPSTWQPWITGPAGTGPFPTFGIQTFFGEGFFANFVYHVPLYNLMTFDMNTGLADADVLAPELNAENADLSAFRAHGGKLIQFNGWADPAVSPLDGIAFYELVRSTMSLSDADAQTFYRLFLAPGMGHCSTGPGANAFGNVTTPPASSLDAGHDVLMALMQWRESGIAPDTLVATKYVSDNPAMGIAFQRPLCVYPKLPRYDGVSPDTTKATSYVCRAPPIRYPIPFPIPR
jgi:hypothetical protein